jgi:hypothetical protein
MFTEGGAVNAVHHGEKELWFQQLVVDMLALLE